jgi:GTP-binding protein
MSSSIRNIAIIAHVDHGKTTLVDGMLKQTGIFRDNQQVDECFLDSNDLERERGITILAKNTVVDYEGVKINIIDTPGHADFGGEVERVLSMADGVLLLVDAAEGPMPQTRFVLTKAFEHHLVPIVVVNKVDKPDARCSEVLNEVYDLFIELDADEEALDFPVLYGSGRDGWVHPEEGVKGETLEPLFKTILSHIPAPTDNPDGALQFRVTSLEWSDYVGRICVGRVHRGSLRVGDTIFRIDHHGNKTEVPIRGIYGFRGISRVEVNEVHAGDLCGVYGIDPIDIGDSLTDLEVAEPMDVIAIDEPTMSIVMRVNDSPFAGRDGKYVTSRHLRDRLDKELRTNVAMRIEQGDSADSFLISGRGVMHLGFLLENMRREGFEFAVGKPQVIFHEENGKRLEPIELLTIDCPDLSSGKIIEIIGDRRGELLSMEKKGNFQRIQFTIPARGLIGVRNRILNASGGEATMNHVFHEYNLHRGEIKGRSLGVLVSMSSGKATAYSLDALKDRGTFFTPSQTGIYEGMIVGENCKERDLVVNLSKEKAANNIRSATKESFTKLQSTKIFGLEDALEYVAEDELVEITPNTIRMRKRSLREKDRKRDSREKAKA